MPVQSKVRQYTEDELDLAALAQKAEEVLGKRPFRWQLEAAQAVLCGRDVILDVGTGCGKTLCFLLPLLLNAKDMGLTVSPLSALMIDQANSSKLSTVAVCQETVSKVGKDQIFEDIVQGKFRQIMVSPEIAVSPEFSKAVLSKKAFTDSVRVINIDEAHCVNVWGGTFRPEYMQLGLLRGRFPKNVSVQAVSATFPDHVLDDVCKKLSLFKDLKTVRVTNARPNIALSVRTMQQPDDSKADLRFLIPLDARTPKDIKITLVYCESRGIAELCTDRLRRWAAEQGIPRQSIAFYHALIGEERKRELEDLLAKGQIAILCCTEALGMGCDLRNIERVVLWGMPRTFCAFVQRAGRAARDLNKQGEAILIVPQSIMNKEIEEAAEEAASAIDIAAEEVDHEQSQSLDNEGIRVEASHNADEPALPLAGSLTAPGIRRKHFNSNTNIHETRALLTFIRSTVCRRIPWDEFFDNAKKLQLVYNETSMYQPKPDQLCCDICQPQCFEVEQVTTSRLEKGLKRGKKKKVPEDEYNYNHQTLTQWRDTTLADKYCEGLTSFSPATLMSNNIIEQIATSGEPLVDYDHLRTYAFWALGHDTNTGGPNEYGDLLLAELKNIYAELDRKHDANMKDAEEREREVERETYNRNLENFDVLTPERYYELYLSNRT